MKKIFAIILTIAIMGLSVLMVSAENTSAVVETSTANEISTTASEDLVIDSNNTAVPAVEHIINLFFDGEITVSQIVEYVTIAVATVFSFAYSKYKRKLILSEKAKSKTDIEIEALREKNQDMTNQIGILGNMIVCAYLSNNLIDPELKKKLAVYAEELMQNTTLKQDKLTEKLIMAAQNPNFQKKVTDLKESILQEALQTQSDIDDIKKGIAALNDTINQDIPSEPQASSVIDSLKIGD